MSWSLIGEMDLTFEWRSFEGVSVNTETFRVSQPGVNTVDGYFLIRPLYVSDGSVGPAKRFYPGDVPKIVVWLIPPVIQQNQLGVRNFQARLSPRARIFAGQSWRVRLEDQ